jgi:hypothetical protein
MNQHFAEQFNICQGFLPVAMNTAANSGDWVSMRDYGRCAIVVFKAVGTAGDDPTIAVKQAQAVAGTNAKALAFTTVYKKQAASNLLAVGTYTKTTSDTPATNDAFNTTLGTWSNTDLAEQAAIIVIDIKAEDLDADNGFDCVQVSIADIGTNAQLGSALYILGEPRYQKDPLNSAIID